MLRRLLPFLLAPLALPAAAHATDFCVAPNTTCGGTNVATLQAALGTADNAANADRVFLGAATYAAPTGAGYVYDAPTFPVEIIGAGREQTVLTGPAGASGILRVNGGVGTLVRDFGILLPQNVPAGTSGLDLADPATRVAIAAHPQQAQGHQGIYVRDGGSVSEASIVLSQAIGNAYGIVVDAPSAAVARSTIAARHGVSVSASGSASVDRVVVTSTGGAVSASGSTVAVTSSLLRPVNGGDALTVNDQPGESGLLIADGVTIAGDGSNGTSGANAGAGFGSTATLTLRNSIVAGVERSLGRFTLGGTANVTVTHSAFDPTTVDEDPGPGTFSPSAGALQPGANTAADPQFADPAAGDFRLRPGSALVDAGDPAAAAGLDLDGNPLLVDGNGDGTARRDMGAFERPPFTPPPSQPAPPAGEPAPADSTAPALSGLRAVPAGVRRGRAVQLQLRLDEPATVRVVVQRSLPGRRVGAACRPATRARRKAPRCTRHVRVPGATAGATLGAGVGALSLPAKPGGKALRPGRHRALVTAVDAAGNRSPTAIVTFRVRG